MFKGLKELFKDIKGIIKKKGPAFVSVVCILNMVSMTVFADMTLEPRYYQTANGEKNFLEYNEEKDAYIAADDIGFIKSDSAKLGKNFLLGRSYIVPKTDSTDYYNDFYTTNLYECDYENGDGEVFTFFNGGQYDKSQEGFNRNSRVVYNWEEDQTYGVYGKVWRVEKIKPYAEAESSYLYGLPTADNDISAICFDIKPTKDNIHAAINIISNNESGSEKKSASITFLPDGTIRADIGWTVVGENAGTKIGNWTDEKWMNFRIVYDKPKTLMTIYINNKKVKQFTEEQLGVSGGDSSFRQMDKIRFYILANVAEQEDALFYIDNVGIKSFTGIPENNGRYRVSGAINPQNSYNGTTDKELVLKLGEALEPSEEYALILPEDTSDYFNKTNLDRVSSFVTEDRISDVQVDYCDYDNTEPMIYTSSLAIENEGAPLTSGLRLTDDEGYKKAWEVKTRLKNTEHNLTLNGFTPLTDDMVSVEFSIKPLENIRFDISFLTFNNKVPLNIGFYNTTYGIRCDRAWQFGSQTKKLIDYQVGKWYDFKLIYDKTQNTMDIYINNMLIKTLDSAYMQNYSGISGIRFMIDGASGEADKILCLLDNIKSARRASEKSTVTKVRYKAGNKWFKPCTEINGLIEQVDIFFNKPIESSTLGSSAVKLFYGEEEIECSRTYNEARQCLSIIPSKYPSEDADIAVLVSGAEATDGTIIDTYSGYVSYKKNGNSEVSAITSMEVNEKDGTIGIDFATKPTSYDFAERIILKKVNGGEEIPVSVAYAKGETVLNILKNGEIVWKQIFPNGEEGCFDLGILLEEGDTVDVEAKTAYGTGNYNEVLWNCEAEKYIGTKFCVASTGAGYSQNVLQEYKLSDLIGTEQGQNGVECYSVRRDIKRSMTYDTTDNRWENNNPSFIGYLTGSFALRGTGGWISSTAVQPGDGVDSVIEVSLPDSGTLRINGDMPINQESEGILSKLYLNDKLIWSNRVGGERPVRWDEPFDISYFSNFVNVTANVKQGDKLKFVFNQWRKVRNDSVYEEVDIRNIKLSYIDGEILSQSTRWKLEESIVVDAKEGFVYRQGDKYNIDVYTDKDGVIYLAKEDIPKTFGTDVLSDTQDTEQYIELCSMAEGVGKNVCIADDRIVLIYDYLPVFFGDTEISELTAALSTSGGLGETAIVNSSGEAVSEIQYGEQYYVKAAFKNNGYSAETFNVMVAEYDDSGVLKEIIPNNITVQAGEHFNMGNQENENTVSFTAEEGVQRVKVFFWYNSNIKPLAAPIIAEIK